MSARSTTSLYTKGQVILPKAVRDQMGWSPGTKLTVEQTNGAVVLRQANPFPETRLEDVFGMFHVPGRPALTVEQMDEAVAAEARDRARD